MLRSGSFRPVIFFLSNMDSPKVLARHRGTKIPLLAATVVFAVMALNALLHYWNIGRMAQMREFVAQYTEKLRAANQLLQACKTRKRANADFCSPAPAYLEPYVRSTSEIDQRFQAFQQLVEQSPSQQQPVRHSDH